MRSQARTSPPQLFTRVSSRWGSLPIHPSTLSRNGIRDGRGGEYQPLMENGSGCERTNTTAAVNDTADTPTADARARVLSTKPSFMSRSFRKLRNRFTPETTSTPSAASPALSSSSSSSASLVSDDSASSLRIPYPSAPPVPRQGFEKTGEGALLLTTPPPLRSATTWMTPASNSETFPTGWSDGDEEGTGILPHPGYTYQTPKYCRLYHARIHNKWC